MRIEKVPPKVPQPEYALTFTRDEGWAVVAALSEYVQNHRQAVERETWLEWASDLDKLLRA